MRRSALSGSSEPERVLGRAFCAPVECWRGSVDGVQHRRLRSRRCRTWVLGSVVIAMAGCAPSWGDSDGYGPWVGSLVAPIAIFDANVVDIGSVDVTLRGGDGAALGVETHSTVTLDDVLLVDEFASNPFERDLYERLVTTASASMPIEMVSDGGVRFEPGRRYRIVLRHFTLSISPEDIDYAVGFAWDLAEDRPADGESAGDWRADLDGLRSAGLMEGSNADAIVAIAQALSTTTPTSNQRDIIVNLLGESMVPGSAPAPPPPTSTPA